MDTVAIIDETLRAALRPVELEVIDDSHRHRGHAGAGKGGHYRVRVVASAFAGLSALARHRLVYDALAPQMESAIHALSIDAKAPDEGGA